MSAGTVNVWNFVHDEIEPRAPSWCPCAYFWARCVDAGGAGKGSLG